MSSLPLVSNREHILRELKWTFKVLWDAPSELKRDRDFMMAAVSQRGA